MWRQRPTTRAVNRTWTISRAHAVGQIASLFNANQTSLGFGYEALEDRNAPATLLHSLFPDPGPQSDVQIGSSVATSSGYYVVGAPYADVAGIYDIGQVFVYNANTGVLIRVLSSPTQAAYDRFGASVAVSGDLLVVGADHPVTNDGSVYVFNATTGLLISTLVNPSPAEADFFGHCVAVSGNTVLVGAYGDDTGATDAGSAYLFDATTGGPIAALNNPSPATNEKFGFSVASAGGNFVVGCVNDNTGATGAGGAYVYDAAGAPVMTLNNPTPAIGDAFGFSVAASGNSVVVGAVADDTGAVDAGSAYVFNATTGTLIATLGNPTPVATENFGNAVAITGNVALIGTAFESSLGYRAGMAYSFNATTGVLIATLANPTPVVEDSFGHSVAILGNAALIGAPFDDIGAVDTGSAYLMDALTGTSPALLNNPTLETRDNFGQSVAISSDYVVVGAPNDGTTTLRGGIVYVYSAPSGELVNRLYYPGPDNNATFGGNVSISGNLIAVSAGYATIGGVYGVGAVFVFDAVTGALISTINNPTPDYTDRFGEIALSGNTLVVGVEHDSAGASDSGIAYTFNALTGALLATLNNPTPVVSDEFGSTVAISGNLVVIGARYDDTTGESSGSAYVFNATTGALLHTLANPTPAASDEFGLEVSIEGNVIAVGAANDDEHPNNVPGIAYLFDATTGALTHTLYNPAPGYLVFFGFSIALTDGLAVIGAFQAYAGPNNNAGAAYAFDIATGDLIATIPNPTPNPGDFYGYAVGVDGHRIVVGALYDDTLNYDQGAAYVFELGVSWDGGGGDLNWSNPLNWTGNTLPGPNDNVFIDVPGSIVVDHGSGIDAIHSLTSAEGVTISGGSLTIGAASTVAGPLVVSNGTLRTLAAFEANGSFNWQGGTLSGIGEFNSDGGFTMTTTTMKVLSGKLLRINAGGTWVTGDLAMDDGAILEIPNGQNLGAEGNTSANRNTGLGSATINVLGTLTRSVASGTVTIGANVGFNNSGVVLVQTGTLSLGGGGTDSGTFTVANGATLTFAGGLNSLNAPSSVTGAGAVSVSGGTLNVAGAFAPGGAVSVTGGVANINSTVALTGSLSVTGGELSGSGNITVAGASSWTGGKLSGAGQVMPNGGLYIAGTTPMFLVGKLLRLGGGGVWTTGDLAMDDGAILEIPTGRTLNQNGAGSLVRNTNTGSADVVLQGTITKSVSAGAAGVGAGIGFSNTGEINVNTGTLFLPSGGTHTGLFTVASGALLEFAAGSNNFVPGSLITGLGNVRISGGTTTFAGGFTLLGTLSVVSTTVQTTVLFNDDIQIASLNVFGNSGGGSVLGGTGNITVSGPSTWSAGRIEGGGVLTCNAGLTLDTASDKTLWGKTLTFAGSLNWTGGNIAIDRGGILNVPVGTVLDAQSDNALVRSDLAGTATLNVLGTFRKSSGAGTTTVDATIAIPNLATVQVQSGTLALPGGRNYAGAFSLTTGSNLQLAAGNNTFTATSTIAGGGNLIILSGTSQFAGPVTLGGLLTVTNLATATFNATTALSDLLLALPSPTVNGSGNITVANTTTWQGGAIAGTGTFAANGAVVFSDSSTKRLSGKAFFFNNTTTWNAGQIGIDEGAVLNVGSSGVFDVKSDNAIVRVTGIGTAKFNNNGILRKSTGAGETAISVPFENFGIVEAQTGTLTVDSGFANFAGSTLSGGTYIVTAIFQFGSANIQTNAAAIVLNGTTSAIRNSGTAANALANFNSNSASGSFTLQGGRNFVSAGAFTNAGNVVIAVGSIFATASGDYTQSAGSTIVNGVLDPAGNFYLAGGALSGSGNVLAPIVVSGNGSIAPGGSPGIFNATQGIAFSAGTFFQAEIDGPVAGTGYDQINVTGAVNLGGAQLVISPGITPTLGQTFVIVNNDDTDAVAGTFGGLAEGAVFTVAGKTFSITYYGGVDNNDVVLTATNADSTPPSIVDIIDVTPDPRTTPVTSIDVIMSEPINLPTFTSTDITLFHDGTFVPFSGNESVVLLSGSTYRVTGLSEETTAAGSYLLIVNAVGITDLAGNAGTNAAIETWGNSFNLDATAPTIVGIYFDGSTWSSGFRAAAGNVAYGYPAQTGASQLTDMPWSNVNTVYVQFSEPVNAVTSAQVGVRGINIPTYTVLSVTMSSPTVAKITLSANFDTDRIILDLDGDSGTAVTDTSGNKLAGSWTEGVSTFPTTGIAGNDFKFRFVVAVGDADRNGLVRNADVNLVRANLFVDAGQAGYNIYVDIDGNGLTRNADVNTVRSHLFVDPPAGPGPFRPGRGVNLRPWALDSQQQHLFATERSSTDRSALAQRRLPRTPAFHVLDALFEEG